MKGLWNVKAFLLFILRSIIAFTASVTTWFVSFFTYDQGFFESGFYALIGGAVVYYIVKAIMKHSTLRYSGLSRSEYRLVQENLKVAKRKISRLQKALWSLSSIPNMKQNIETLRVVNKIQSITKKEPRRFFLVDEFYYSHLDSIVELAEKYAFLSNQPAKTKELSASLRDTKITMNEINETIKNDLYKMLENDIDTLQFELDVAKQNVNKKKWK